MESPPPGMGEDAFGELVVEFPQRARHYETGAETTRLELPCKSTASHRYLVRAAKQRRYLAVRVS